MMSQPSSEERRKFVLVFTGPAASRDGTALPVRGLISYMEQWFNWKNEMQLDLPLSARVEIKEADDKPPADERDKTK